jgi:hypothetical protein
LVDAQPADGYGTVVSNVPGNPSDTIQAFLLNGLNGRHTIWIKGGPRGVVWRGDQIDGTSISGFLDRDYELVFQIGQCSASTPTPAPTKQPPSPTSAPTSKATPRPAITPTQGPRPTEAAATIRATATVVPATPIATVATATPTAPSALASLVLASPTEEDLQASAAGPTDSPGAWSTGPIAANIATAGAGPHDPPEWPLAVAILAVSAGLGAWAWLRWFRPSGG